ncbi:N-acetylglucosamine kinase [Saccharopolyspora phatthalungensis]|uniref:N-acetylglucosamine kinase-like BadF-type ATPase n=1 Tax=Saccharopolyspora phatthalungensis TaxID=664693 RepID=A0A840Q2S7_9PSEU|nr:BadF/BadG/BcrA/BcrD ATPase family protein [Saccharopolyspora phatthalungensis]MBB5153891.1 N-acetylglucosamine kinase-like BadF-type ATPase [Saccharopolyspora phatthalungensis]
MHCDEAALVLGLDIGGTSSRALVSDLSGRVLGSGEAAGGNPNSHPADEAVRQIAKAACAALRDIDPAAVRNCVVGMAGVSKMADPEFSELFDREWSRLGLHCPKHPISDCEVAFAAGTSAPGGTVLIAGTGAIAARIEQHRIAVIVGGHGWLLGDEGSAFWLGREAVRAALRALDRGEPLHGLTAAVRDRLLPNAPDAQRKQLISAVNAAPPIHLAELAPLVTSVGDETAEDIIRRAARVLADTVAATRSPADTSPIVLAGGLLARGNPVGEALRAELADRGYGKPRVAGSGAAGAAWLAALDLTADPTALHNRLLG